MNLQRKIIGFSSSTREIRKIPNTWRRHQKETFSASLTTCERNPQVTDGFPSQRRGTRRFDIFFDVRLNKRLGKHSRRWWFETSRRSWWHNCNDMHHINVDKKWKLQIYVVLQRTYSAHNGLTHWERVTHVCVSKLTIIGLDKGLSLVSAKPFSEPMLIRTVGTKLQRNCNRNSCIFIQENALKNIFCDTASIFSRSQYVNSSVPSCDFCPMSTK